jgi:HEAT repeat protein
MKVNRSSDAPRLPDDSSLEIKVVEHPFKFKNSSDKKLNSMIVETINAMGAFGDDADKNYQKLVRQLRENDNAVSVLVDEYTSIDESQYLDKWSVIELLGEVGNEKALDFLDKITSEKLPREKSKDPHSFSTVGEEVMLRTTSIDGISKLASRGNKRAVSSLLKHIQNENFSVKRAAVQAFVEVGGKDALEILRKELPKEFHHILEIHRTDVRKVPQAEGGLFVRTNDKDNLPKLK